MGYLYLLLEINQHGEESHKIGISKNEPNKRLKQLQTGNSNEIRILNQYESINYKKIEKILHAKYKLKQTLSKNEWFKLSDNDVFTFLEECKKADHIVSLLSDNPFF
jgi:hypothetical protein